MILLIARIFSSQIKIKLIILENSKSIKRILKRITTLSPFLRIKDIVSKLKVHPLTLITTAIIPKLSKERKQFTLTYCNCLKKQIKINLKSKIFLSSNKKLLFKRQVQPTNGLLTKKTCIPSMIMYQGQPKIITSVSLCYLNLKILLLITTRVRLTLAILQSKCNRCLQLLSEFRCLQTKRNSKVFMNYLLH